MKVTETGVQNKQIFYRLVALWVICEGLIGGIIHGLKLPVSGLIVGSCAVICITLIAYYVPNKGAILKATILVAIFKMMLSPHSPPMAYIAVFFQGLTGELFFSNRKKLKYTVFIFAVIALAESALQRIFVLWLIYGDSFWLAMNKAITKIFPSASGNNYILQIAVIYTLFHCVVGIVVAVLSLKIIRLNNNRIDDTFLIDTGVSAEKSVNEGQSTGQRSKFKIPFLIIWILLGALLIQSSFHLGKPLLNETSIGMIVIRAIVIMLSWYFIISPLLMFYLKKWLSKEKKQSQEDISAILGLLPGTRLIFEQGWRLSQTEKGFRRILLACKIIIINTIHQPHDR